ncbi:MAG: HAMP domain-containing histidine kinase [Gemmatimonadota bacterium]|nr:HAMP domain-containing histidine kinase [Gemmatimonadota bacterium]
MTVVRADRWRAAWWPVAAAIALLAASQWLNGTSVQYLAAAALATAAAAAGLRTVSARGRVWAGACTIVLVAVVLLSALSQWKLYRIDAHWPDIRASLSGDALAALDRRVDETVARMHADAERALAAPADTAGAFAAMGALVPPVGDAGVVLYERGEPLAWAGRVHVATDSLVEPVGVARSSFYTSLYAVAVRGGRRAVVTELLDAVPPADRLSHPIAGEIAGVVGIPGFEFAPAPAAATAADWEALRDHTKILIYVRPAALTEAAVRLEALQSARLVVAVALALALVCFLIAAWRVGRRFRWRLATVGVGLLCTASVPLGTFSNYSRLFDASLFYTPIGGALTANAGALIVTGVLVMLALLAAVRRLARHRPRAWWALAVLLIAGLGPFLLRDLARGISIPIYGVNASLWLIWEVPIFLAGSAVLLAGATAGSAALGPRRGVPPWVGPLLAAGAAVLAPVTWQADGRWPWWYPIPWIVAIAALALSRRSRAIVSSAAAVAALGATTLVWGATTRGRMSLAEHDVQGLSQNDPYVVSLVERFGASVRAAGPPEVSRQWLLRAYAGSPLAPAGFPVWLSIWTNDSTPAAVLPASSMQVPMVQARAIATQARAVDSTVEYPIIAEPAVQFGMGIPVGKVVIVVVAASRTRLISADPFAKLLGIDQPPEAEPPYVLQLAEAPLRPPVGAPSIDWRREGTALHGDWIARGTGLGPSRVHLEVELRSVDALIQRGTLVVLFDLAIVGLLWLMSVLADGAVGRWLRERQRRWRRSYRTQLTLALFGFFMIPAAAFAAWAYGELASDARQSRELLVGETLRAVAPVTGTSEWLADESRRLSTPLFLYRDGELTAASDSLLASLAPTGRFLPAATQLALGVHDEVAQSRDETLGASHALFGFRAVDDPHGPVVLAAPARADDLALDRRRRDLGILVLFATVTGALAAFLLSGLVARGLAGPIRSLRQAALTLAASGRAPTLEDNPTVEFRPVFAAFRRMATDLEASRAATAHAERVLAWGEMARQVAHEIKNPLTPIRLGVQHLQRARADKRVDFDRVLDENVKRILAEIDHLDAIARAFSRYGAPPNARPAGEPTDVSAVVRDLIGLERMGEEGIDWPLEADDGRCVAIAQRDELREVLLNVYENARLAGAHTIATTLRSTNGSVAIEVRDDGHGIPGDVLPRVFEPHFSTRTSGSGLGLAISRQLIEGWGGTIDLESAEGEGSLVRITLASA